MPYRKDILATDCLYHVFNRSIAEFKIFRNKFDYRRFLEAATYYQIDNPPIKLSVYKKSPKKYQLPKEDQLIKIIAYCLMPTHFHFILCQSKNLGVSTFINRLLNSYTHYFNNKYKRKGPLWEGRFKTVIIRSEEQLLHLTRYLHLNPVTDHLVEKPEQWQFSSYQEYVRNKENICSFKKFLDIKPREYIKFVLARKDYQRKLARIKDLLLETNSFPAAQI